MVVERKERQRDTYSCTLVALVDRQRREYNDVKRVGEEKITYSWVDSLVGEGGFKGEETPSLTSGE